MNIIDLRTSLRESSNTRCGGDRRQNPHPFGSPEWLEYIRTQGLEQPIHDRRKMLRRANDRRSQVDGEQKEQAYKRILLTTAEKKLLADMYLADMDSAES
ncbi:hypothetical protein [Methylovulum psychrotolerans]|uniref:Uncharacterized protein n=1 Tax=Methylovulum psychrotolerans TaxID=1704499 RepID=A0A2S5CIF1_9GAMM|nr:hypothetical protein [Methylovulum psychrotolerans]POZ50512.1 hypothetical protein AADEFJLK_03708 [Methylovulum psychrotolerans]